MFPVRCYTCDSVIAQHWERYTQHVRDGDKAGRVLTSLGQTRMCCRRMFLSHVDLISEQKAYPCEDVVLDENGTMLRRKVDRQRISFCN